MPWYLSSHPCLRIVSKLDVLQTRLKLTSNSRDRDRWKDNHDVIRSLRSPGRALDKCSEQAIDRLRMVTEQNMIDSTLGRGSQRV